MPSTSRKKRRLSMLHKVWQETYEKYTNLIHMIKDSRSTIETAIEKWSEKHVLDLFHVPDTSPFSQAVPCVYIYSIVSIAPIDLFSLGVSQMLNECPEHPLGDVNKARAGIRISGNAWKFVPYHLQLLSQRFEQFHWTFCIELLRSVYRIDKYLCI